MRTMYQSVILKIVYMVCYGILQVKEKEEDVEGDDHWTSASAKLELQVKSFHTLGQAWPTSEQTQGKNKDVC